MRPVEQVQYHRTRHNCRFACVQHENALLLLRLCLAADGKKSPRPKIEVQSGAQYQRIQSSSPTSDSNSSGTEVSSDGSVVREGAVIQYVAVPWVGGREDGLTMNLAL